MKDEGMRLIPNTELYQQTKGIVESMKKTKFQLYVARLLRADRDGSDKYNLRVLATNVSQS